MTQLATHAAKVARLVGKGLDNQQIAERIGTNSHAVSSTISKILRDLNLSDRAALVNWARNPSLTDPLPTTSGSEMAAPAADAPATSHGET